MLEILDTAGTVSVDMCTVLCITQWGYNYFTCAIPFLVCSYSNDHTALRSLLYSRHHKKVPVSVPLTAVQRGNPSRSVPVSFLFFFLIARKL